MKPSSPQPDPSPWTTHLFDGDGSPTSRCLSPTVQAPSLRVTAPAILERLLASIKDGYAYGRTWETDEGPTDLGTRKDRQVTGDRRMGVTMSNTAKRLVLRLAARCRDPGVLNPATAAASARSSR